jgi:hypothetical protein
MTKIRVRKEDFHKIVAQDPLINILLDYADWMRRGGSMADGYPRKSIGAHEARIHSIADLEIGVAAHVMQCVDTAIADLKQPFRGVILRSIGLQLAVWRLAHEETLYADALEMLRVKLKEKIVC